MPLQGAKVRINAAGYHYFDRGSGLNILLDEFVPSTAVWHQAPRQVSIALTNRCDLRCPYCYAPKNRATLDPERLQRWLLECDEHGCLGVGFGGGEPTLHPRFADLCVFTARHTRLATTFTSHGHGLTPAILARLEGHVNFVRLSMDGVGSTYERLRGRSFTEFGRQVDAVKRVAAFGINFVVNDDTVGELDAAMEFARRHGAKEFLLLPEQPVRGRSKRADSTRERLLAWVEHYRGEVRLLVSEAGSDGLPVCDPLGRESGLSGYAHVSAAGVLQRTSFHQSGEPIMEAGFIAALAALRSHPESS